MLRPELSKYVTEKVFFFFAGEKNWNVTKALKMALYDKK